MPRDVSPPLVPGVQVSQFHPEDGSLDRVETAVVATKQVPVFFPRAIVRQGANPLGKRRIVGRDRPPIAHRPEILGGIETPADHIPMTAQALAAVACAVGLRRIFDDFQAMAPGQCHDGFEITGLTVQVNRQNDSGSRCDRVFDLPGIDVEGTGSGLDRGRSG